MAVERTLVLFKPDAVARRLSGELLRRFESRGLKIVGLKLLQVTPELSKKHYAEHVSKPFYPQLESFITSAPVVAVALEGPEAVSVVRAMMGPTNGRAAAPGTIRGDFGLSRQMNLVHGSDGPEAAAKELAIYFQPHELLTYTSPLDPLTLADDEK
ncbi:MAG TPA: nucleoside-diphosphate kinase [Planctomycetaceae bacterium]|nr:nucleoside-diphosphate kinase [Planctomycetaceae bacterium]